MIDPYTLLLIVAGIVGWFICGVANYVAYRSLFGGATANDMSSDFLVALGPAGTVMLIIIAALMGFLSACKKVGQRISGSASTGENHNRRL